MEMSRTAIWDFEWNKRTARGGLVKLERLALHVSCRSCVVSACILILRHSLANERALGQRLQGFSEDPTSPATASMHIE
jgi:hypothetical protein